MFQNTRISMSKGGDSQLSKDAECADMVYGVDILEESIRTLDVGTAEHHAFRPNYS